MRAANICTINDSESNFSSSIFMVVIVSYAIDWFDISSDLSVSMEFALGALIALITAVAMLSSMLSTSVCNSWCRFWIGLTVLFLFELVPLLHSNCFVLALIEMLSACCLNEFSNERFYPHCLMKG
jgi:hypothetical protein